MKDVGFGLMLYFSVLLCEYLSFFFNSFGILIFRTFSIFIFATVFLNLGIVLLFLIVNMNGLFVFFVDLIFFV